MKYYSVWKGRETGVFDSWDRCKKSVDRYVGAQYKSFPSMAAAEMALNNPYEASISHDTPKKNTSPKTLTDDIITPSIAVDGAWNTVTGWCEYQGVETENGKLLFHGGPYADGTNNIVEFLAIVHALRYCKDMHIHTPIYSDSHTAIVWVQSKRTNTKLLKSPENTLLFEEIHNAELWLQKNIYTNQIIKWETQEWGEIPADFGRK